SQFFPDLDISPGRGQVLVTEEIENLKVKGVFHLEEGYYYFRNYGKRIIFGGGRNLDFEGEKTHRMEVSDVIMPKLEEMLAEIILPENTYSIERRWAGIMAFGQNKEPICQQVDDRLFAAVRLGGMGVAIGSALGKEMAGLLLK
ncbi:MAG: FAD-dependent oxidoreductase, partial [Bacteroidota bacterium]